MGDPLNHPTATMSAPLKAKRNPDELDIASLLIHADQLGSEDIPVGVPISVTTTFRHARPAGAVTDEEEQGKLHGENAEIPDTFDPAQPDRHVYSRYTQPVLTRTEKVLSALVKAHAIAFGTGLSAVMAALLHYQPEIVAITEGYHGTHEVFKLYGKLKPGFKVISLDDDYAPFDGKNFVCWLETPVNPFGTCRDIEHFASKTHALKQGKLVIDATFGPPPLQDPFEFEADMVMHSGTKYFAGHSDALVGVLATKDPEELKKLWEIRTFTGMVPGSLESWLLLRSLRTANLRVMRQSTTATALAVWLNQVATNASDAGSSYDGCPGGVLKSVTHAVLQGTDGAGGGRFNPLGGSAVGADATARRPQMTSGPACFSIVLTKKNYAAHLPHEMKLMVPATSLGGVESLIEQRLVSDANADPCLVRISIGLEDLEDLKQDFRNAFATLLGGRGANKSKL